MTAEQPTTVLPFPSEARTVAKEKMPHGLMAEFKEHDQLLNAVRRAYASGYRRMDAFSPFPIEEMSEALGDEYTPVPLITLLGGMAGGLGGYFMQWYSMVRLYPLNVGGRPLNTWPHFIPVVFELTVLIAALSAFTAVLVLNRLPQLHHPVFNVPAFRRASIDRFFFCIEAEDPKFEADATWRFLQTLAPLSIAEVWDE